VTQSRESAETDRSSKISSGSCSGQPIIEVENFTKRYGNFIAVDDISFTLDEGSIFAFLGPNGAGKSTTINTLCTIYDDYEGRLAINGFDVARDKNQVRSSIGIVFQETTLDQKMTIEENLRMHCVFYQVPRAEVEERIQFVLTLVDLLDWRKRSVAALSGGMKRRVEIARGLIHYPKVLFLDEPTSGLDPQTRAHVWEYILRLQKEKNITIFLTTHYMDEAEICNQVAIIDHGKIIAHDTPFDLKKSYTQDRAYITTTNPLLLETLLDEHGFPYQAKERFHRVDIIDTPKLLNILAECRHEVTDIEIRKGTLNDVFLEITGREIREGGDS